MAPGRLFIFSVCLLISSLPAISQKGIVEGYVGDEQNHYPLAGVTIKFTDNSFGDNSDNFGMFKIIGVNAGHYELSISHIGYTTKKIQVDVEANKTTVIKTNMEPGILDLSTVSVYAKRNSILNTVASLDIKLRPVNTSQDILDRITPIAARKPKKIFLAVGIR